MKETAGKKESRNSKLSVQLKEKEDVFFSRREYGKFISKWYEYYNFSLLEESKFSLCALVHPYI